MKEKIKLTDFLNDVIIAYDLSPDEFLKETRYSYSCSKCKKWYSEGTKFCGVDGEKVIKESYEVLSEDTKRDIYRTIYDFESYTDVPESFPYEFVDTIETRGDGSGYYLHIIFKRKLDGKFFKYCSYDGRIEEGSFDETKQIVKIKWDFE
jgi:hypothetical protein